MLTVFAWGYEGWGNSTRELLQAFDTAEQARGFEPPVFVLVSVAAARFHAGEWKMPLFVHPVEQDDTGALLLRHARQFRRQSMLEEFRTG